MTLQIRIIKAPHSASLAQNNHIFDESGGTVGRGPGNTWVLPDPERILSSRHCEFVFEGGCYHLIDLSTNGTFINGSPEPIGKGARAQLAHGDSVEIGDYCFSVALEHASQDNLFSADSQPLEMESPFASTSDSNFSNSPFGNNSFEDQAPLSLNSEADVVDPLQALDQAGSTSSADAFFGTSQTETGSDHIFSPTNNDVTSEQPISEAVAWPEAVSENLIPDDWDLDDGLDSSLDHSAASEEVFWGDSDFGGPADTPFQTESIPEQGFMAPTDPPFADPSPSQPQPEWPRSGASAASAPSAGPVPPAGAVMPAQSAAPVHQPVLPLQQEAQPSRAPQPQSMPRGPVRAVSQGDPLIAAMGLDPAQFDQARRDELHTLVGSLMRDVVEGLMQAMRARASIKNEFRMNVTTIQPVENNPLKFSADVNEAMENIFVRQSNAYKAPADAVKEGFKEIAGHQMAMIAGMREAFEEMLKGFGPSRLEQNFRRHQKPGAIPVLQNARYWRQYQAHYQELTDNLERSFQQIFGDVFVQAYEDQLRRLAASRKP